MKRIREWGQFKMPGCIATVSRREIRECGIDYSGDNVEGREEKISQGAE